MTWEGNVKADILRETKVALMQRDKPRLRAGPALHIHHAERHAGNIEGSDVKDLHASDESLVECASKEPMRVEFLLEADEVHRRCHRIVSFSVLRYSDVDPRETAFGGPLYDLVHYDMYRIVLLVFIQKHVVKAECHLAITGKHE